ncbi:MAG: hypothetical protein NTX86_04600 [Candidatus Dependentiae bacterium]|nr:hypothetical protein [Candidatus Dependentiae bacterium]
MKKIIHTLVIVTSLIIGHALFGMNTPSAECPTDTSQTPTSLINKHSVTNGLITLSTAMINGTLFLHQNLSEAFFDGSLDNETKNKYVENLEETLFNQANQTLAAAGSTLKLSRTTLESWINNIKNLATEKLSAATATVRNQLPALATITTLSVSTYVFFA